MRPVPSSLVRKACGQRASCAALWCQVAFRAGPRPWPQGRIDLAFLITGEDSGAAMKKARAALGRESHARAAAADGSLLSSKFQASRWS